MANTHSKADDGRESETDLKKGSSSEPTSKQSGNMSFLETTQSVLWAMLGVQSKRNASRDFSRGKFIHFVIIGLALTCVFIFTLVGIIRYVLGDAV